MGLTFSHHKDTKNTEKSFFILSKGDPLLYITKFIFLSTILIKTKFLFLPKRVAPTVAQ